MIDPRLSAAAIFTLGMAVGHSWAGERSILRPVLASPLELGSPRRSDFVRATLRFAWHLTSLLLLGCAAILAALSSAPLDLAALFTLEIIGALFLACAAITASYSGARHIAWPFFLAAALMCLWSAALHQGGAPISATSLPVGSVVAGLLVAASLLHAYWALRGAASLRFAIPEHGGAPVLTPGRLATSLVAFALLAASLLVAAQAADLAIFLPRGLVTSGCWALAIVFLVRTIGDFRFVGLFKAVKDTPFALCDTAAYTPLCLLLGLTIGALAASSL